MLYNKSMVQDQLVDYISSQMKAGVSREAIKAALVGAGWVAADVEDTFKKVEGVAKTAPPASTALAGTSPSGASPASAAFKPAAMIGGGAVKSGEPQSIRVSDLVSASAAANLSTGAGAGFGKSTSTTKTQQPAGLAVTARMGADPKSAHGGRVMMIIGIVVIIVLGGLAGYLYFQNNNLASQVASLGSQSTGVTSQISSLSGQVQALTASNTALTAAAASLTGQNTDLLTNLSFVAVPAGTPSGASSTVSVSGTLTGGKSVYTLTTAYGVVIYVANAKDAKVSAALAPLLAGTSTVELTGTHVAGSQYITVTAVNGSSL